MMAALTAEQAATASLKTDLPKTKRARAPPVPHPIKYHQLPDSQELELAVQCEQRRRQLHLIHQSFLRRNAPLEQRRVGTPRGSLAKSAAAKVAPLKPYLDPPLGMLVSGKPRCPRAAQCRRPGPPGPPPACYSCEAMTKSGYAGPRWSMLSMPAISVAWSTRRRPARCSAPNSARLRARSGPHSHTNAAALFG